MPTHSKNLMNSFCWGSSQTLVSYINCIGFLHCYLLLDRMLETLKFYLLWMICFNIFAFMVCFWCFGNEFCSSISRCKTELACSVANYHHIAIFFLFTLFYEVLRYMLWYHQKVIHFSFRFGSWESNHQIKTHIHPLDDVASADLTVQDRPLVDD